MIEKRRFERVDAAFETRYTKSQGHATISSLSTTRDISLNGLCSKLSRVVNVKDTILMEIKLADRQRIATLARVVWLKPDPNNCNNMCGLKFLWTSSREILNESIKEKQTA